MGTFENNEKMKEYQKNNKLARTQFYEKQELWEIPEKHIKYDLTSRELIKIYGIKAVECMELSYTIVPHIVLDSYVSICRY